MSLYSSGNQGVITSLEHALACIARRWRFCFVGQNTSVLAPCLAPACIASHEVTVVTDFNGAENLCAGLISASSRRLLFILSCSIRRGRS
jgi:hypothetical protein